MSQNVINEASAVGIATDKADAESLITEHLDLWSSAITRKNTTGRGSSQKYELYGIKKLRELILELAVRGKLVSNNLDECVDKSVLKKMEEEKADFHAKKGVRLQKFKPISEEFHLPRLPKNWREVYFDKVISYITDFQANGSFATLKENVKYYDEPNFALLIRLTDLRHGLNTDKAFKYTDRVGYDFLSKSCIEGGELVVANVGAGVGTTLEVPEVNMPATLAPNMFMVVLSKLISKKYFLLYSQSPIYKRYIQLVNTGTGQPKINKTEYRNCKLPLPPLEEQHRIVAKVDELMALCDQLENQTEQSLDAHATLVDTLLDALTRAQSAEELAENWQRLEENWDILLPDTLAGERAIDKLKQTILQLAIMGRLVEQDAGDDPAVGIITRANAKKSQLLSDKLIKKQKELPDIAEAEKPFSIPFQWAYARLDDICSEITSGSTPPKSEFSETSGVPYLKIYNIRAQRIDFEYKSQFVTEKYHQTRLKRSRLAPGDVVMNIVGPPLGKTAIIPADYPEWNCNQAIVRFRPIEIELNQFIHLYLKAGTFLKTIELIGTAGQDNISVTKSRSIVIPLPPKAEQHRIVQKVEELMGLCDQLKERLNQANETRCQFAEAIVEQGLSA